METQASKSPHMLYWIAGIAVTVFSVVGIAAVMGWIPTSTSSPTEKIELAKETAPAKPAAPAAYKAPAQTAEQARAQAREQARIDAREQAREQARIDARERARDARIAARTPVKAPCPECGVVESVREIATKGEGSGIGVVGGAVVGGLLGHQVGGGRGKDIATVAGAVGGAVAGNEIEKRVKTGKSYEITVRLEDGSTRVISEANPPTWRAGDRVKIVNGVIQSNA